MPAKRGKRARAVLAAGVCAGACAHCGAQVVASGQTQSGAASAAAPVMRVTTRLVQVSVVVEDKKGKPVSGLKPEDFQLLDNGKPQSISLFTTEADLLRERAAAPTVGGSAKPNYRAMSLRTAGRRKKLREAPRRFCLMR